MNSVSVDNQVFKLKINYKYMILLIVILVIVSGYTIFLKIENWMSKRMNGAKDKIILNLKQQIRMKDNKIYALRRRIERAKARNRKILFRSDFKAWFDYYFPKVEDPKFAGVTQFHCDALYELLKDGVKVADLKKE